MIIVHPSLPVKTIKELLALAKAKPGQLNYGSTPGSPNHLAIELLNVQAAVKMIFIPYKGAGQATAELVAGHVQVSSLGFPSSLAMVQAGKLRALAVTSARRSAMLPELPTVAESGVPGYDVNSWYGMFAPANLPDAIVQKIAADLAVQFKSPDVVKRLTTLGAEVLTMAPAEFSRFVRDEIRKWAPVVKASGAKAE